MRTRRERCVRCVLCPRPAQTWTGHLRMGAAKIIAGWCEGHGPKDVQGYPFPLKASGYVGEWSPSYGAF